MYIQEIYVDCDADTLIFKVKPAGAACHTGNYSCFYRKAEGESLTEVKTEHAADPGIFSDVYKVIEDRRDNPKEGSYTNYLFEKGIDKILKRSARKRQRLSSAQKTRVRTKSSTRSRI